MKDPAGGLRPASGLAPLFFAAGAAAVALQVFLLRELMVSLQGDEAALGLGLAAWLAGIAVGAASTRRESARRPSRWSAATFALLVAWGPAGIVIARVARALVASAPGEVLSLGPSILLAAAVAAPPGVLVGALFPALAGLAYRSGASPGAGIARLYILEALGSLASGLLTTFLFLPWFSPIHGSLLVGAACALAAIPAARAGRIPGRAGFPLLALGLVLVGLLPLAPAIEEATEGARFRSIVPGLALREWADTPYQHIAIAGGDVRHLYTSGLYAGSFPDVAEHEVRAHVLACLSPSPERVLVVGRLALGGLGFLLRHPVRRVDLVEIDGQALEIVRGHLAGQDRVALEDPRVHVTIDDPRRFLGRGSDLYDLIVLEQPDPATLLLARFSTVEFFRLVRARLAPEGVFATRLATAPNVVAGKGAALGGAIFGALEAAFPVVRVGPGPDSVVVAGNDPDSVTLHPSRLARRFRERGIPSHAFAPEMFPGLFPPERVAALEAELRAAAIRTGPSTDERPVSFLHALSVRQTIAGGVLAPALRAAGEARPGTAVLAVLFPSLVTLGVVGGKRARGKDARPLAALHAVAVTGACGMGFSLIFLFVFQTTAGALYGHLGLLTAVFMLGIAGGGLAARRGASASKRAADSWLLAASAASLAFAAIVVPWVGSIVAKPWSSAGSAGTIGTLLFLAGAVTGAVFPASVGVLLTSGRDVFRTAGNAESADHAGAAVAAVATAVVLVPSLGTRTALLALAALELLSVVTFAAAVLPLSPRRGL